MSAGRSEPRPVPVPADFRHHVTFSASLATEGGIVAECRPCTWRIWVDDDHDLADLTELVRQHSGEPAAAPDGGDATVVLDRFRGFVRGDVVRGDWRELAYQLSEAVAGLLRDRDDARRVVAIRAILDSFEWEIGDAHYALEKVDEVVRGGDQ